MEERARIAFVTGAASGIGAAIALRLAADGITTVCADRDTAGARRTADAITAIGGTADVAELDVAVDHIVFEVARDIQDRYGALDILVNCAGISGDIDTNTATMSDVRRVLAVNLEGSIAVVLAFRSLLAGSPSGRILNIASIQGFLGARNSLAYGASKGGLINLTRGLACDLADDGILVNALAPGFVDTPMAILEDGRKEYDTDWFRDGYVTGGRIPLRRPASPAEVAEAAMFFCSPANSYVTGQVLAVDGGLSATF
jgi:NAD(P)-dependent dehydrogenase (short-subunit alcohol dehydrogenase family)